MVDCWIECCNSNHSVKYLIRDKTDKKAMGSFFIINGTVPTHLCRSLQHWDTEWVKAGDEEHNMNFLRVKVLAEHLQTA